jgi:selT/selW/selH-like putative selenoprotein
LEARIKEKYEHASVELIRSSGGVFEVTRNGQLIYSKRATGQHPSWYEIESQLDR